MDGTLTATLFGSYVDSGDLPGTVNGTTDGTRTGPGVLSGIVLGPLDYL